MFLKKVYFIVLSFLFVGCGGNSMVDSNSSSSSNNINALTERDKTDDSQNYEGFGFSVGEYEGRVFVTYVYEESPADVAGFSRGTEVLEIDGKRVCESLLRDSGAGGGTQFKLLNHGVEELVTIERTLIEVHSVFSDKIFYIDDKKIGYFVLNAFIEPTRLELDALFDKFDREEIDELVLDMRYNMGGSVSVANYLANLIVGENLDRVFIISTEKSSSVDEALIEELEPYITVNLIGSKSFEKDSVSMELKIVDELEPRCYVLDDTLHQLGDRDESMLKETLFFMKYGICSAVSKRYSIGEEKVYK